MKLVVAFSAAICALFLFRQCASEVSENSMDSQSYAINGTYTYLNTTGVTLSDGMKCPQSIWIADTALMYKDATDFAVDLAGLKITTVNCTYETETDEPNFVKLTNHVIKFGRREPLKEYTVWNMTLPEDSLKCTPKSPAGQTSRTFYGGKLSFVPIPALQESLGMADDHEESQDEMKKIKGKVDYLILLGDESIDEMCVFFPTSQYNEMKQVIEERFQEHQENDDMRIGMGKSLKFCPICECGEKLGTDLDLNSVVMKDDVMSTTEMPTPEEEEDEGEYWRPPEVRIRDQRCPVAYSNKFEKVIKDDEDEDEDKSKDDTKDIKMSEEGNHDMFRETKKLVLYAVVNKLYDEVRDEMGDELDESGFDMRRTMVSVMSSLHRRRVMFMKKGAKCGPKKRPIDRDTLFLYERKHILRQYYRSQYLSKNVGRVNDILDSEEEGVEAFTLHVLQENNGGQFSVCALSNSQQACALLSTTSFCESFRPLRSMTETSSPGKGGPPNSGQPDMDGPPPGKPSTGGPPTRQPDTGGTPPTIQPSTGGPPTTGQPTTGGTTSTEQSNTGGTAPTGQPSTGGPTGQATTGGTSTGQPSTSGQGAQSPSPSPTPINPSPTPSEQPANRSNNGLCFPAVARVEVEDGRIVRMDELKVGDSIRDSSGSFSKVILFTHAAKDLFSEFVRLETDLADIVLSAQHYLPVNGNLMTAESAKEGDTVFILRNRHKQKAIVRRIGRVWMWGLFNPQTMSGSVAVWMNGDAVIASTYTAAINLNLAHSLLAPLRMLSYMLGGIVPWSWFFENGSDTLVKMLPSGNSVA